MKRILYFMFVPWGWIKQRPHFLAEYLSERYQIDVFYRKPLRNDRAENVAPGFPNLRIGNYVLFPFKFVELAFKLQVAWINRLLFCCQVRGIRRYDIVWITDPIQYWLIKKALPRTTKVVYDCMDNIIEFPNVYRIPFYKNLVIDNERQLIARADVMTCSSDCLMETIRKRYDTQRPITIVNNAIELPEPIAEEDLPASVREHIEKVRSLPFSAMYVGTLSEWFDMQTMCDWLHRTKDTYLVLAGPSEIQIPQNDRILYLGTIERKYIFSVMKYANALVMPFVLNDLILSVNPVKLYEYVYMGKPVVAVKYGETLKFSDDVYLYDDGEMFVELMEDIRSGRKSSKRSPSDMRAFAERNTWRSRSEQILKMIE